MAQRPRGLALVRPVVGARAALVDALLDEQLTQRLDAIAYLAAAAIALGRYEDGLGYCERGLSLARATGQEQLFPLLIHSKGFGLCMTGRLEQAVDVIDGATEVDQRRRYRDSPERRAGERPDR